MRTIIALVFLFVFSSCAFAQTTEERLENLEKTLKKQEQTIQELKALQKTVKKQEQTIDEQRKLIEKLTAKTQKPQPSAEETGPGALAGDRPKLSAGWQKLRADTTLSGRAWSRAATELTETLVLVLAVAMQESR